MAWNRRSCATNLSRPDNGSIIDPVELGCHQLVDLDVTRRRGRAVALAVAWGVGSPAVAVVSGTGSGAVDPNRPGHFVLFITDCPILPMGTSLLWRTALAPQIGLRLQVGKG